MKKNIIMIGIILLSTLGLLSVMYYARTKNVKYINDIKKYTNISMTIDGKLGEELPSEGYYKMTSICDGGSISWSNATHKLKVKVSEGPLKCTLAFIELEEDINLVAITIDGVESNTIPTTGSYLITYSCKDENNNTITTPVIIWNNDNHKLTTTNITSKIYCTVNFYPTTYAYSGVGYLMLYDRGDEFTQITGCWSNFVTYQNGWTTEIGVKNTDNLYLVANTILLGVNFTTTKKVNFTDYNKYYQKITYITDGEYWNQCSIFSRLLSYPNLISHISEGESIILINNHCTFSGTNIIQSTNITEYNDEYYLDLSNTAVTGINSQAKFYSIWLSKDDNFVTWRDLAGLSSSTYTTLESIVTDSTAMNTIVNSPKAVSYMLSSSGSIMMSVLENNVAYSSLTTEIKSRAKENEHWIKFASLYGRTL